MKMLKLSSDWPPAMFVWDEARILAACKAATMACFGGAATEVCLPVPSTLRPFSKNQLRSCCKQLGRTAK